MTTLAAYQPYIDRALVIGRVGCYWSLRTLGWALVCLACVIALNVLFFVMLGNFTVEGLLYQLDNFGSRYLAADNARRAEFAHIWLFANILLLCAVCFFRRHSLIIPSSTAKDN
ncbi:hypothetical protein [uncultured Sphingorhabdus sp.]|uniref:hypothetical protein n=1 Tax=uncultured Sphingorhabdus sp. TaxID=1686106 RepID=UPI002619E379|nr:hypothetical protein [uncultured Sphingorhabdus sp.]HMS20524.1 hypothetical protein [Sphingorhabdus sp.]